VSWASFLPILSFRRLSVLDLGQARNRQRGNGHHSTRWTGPGMLWLEVGRFVCHNPSWPGDVARYILLHHNVFLSLIFSFTSCARNTTGITGPYLSRELRDHPLEMLTSKIFNTISACFCSCSCQYCYRVKQKYCIFFSPEAFCDKC